MRRHGHRCDSGFIYFAGSNERVEVPFDDELIALTLSKLAELRATATGGIMPPPLVDSPKCVRCSLAPICLPDEMRFLREPSTPPRLLIPAADHAFPMYVQQPGAMVRKNGDLLQVFDGDEKLGEMRTREVSQLVLMGRVSATEAVYRELLGQGKPIVHLSGGGWLHGVTDGLPHANVRLRQQQYRIADDAEKCLEIARQIVVAKLSNQRTFLRRNGTEEVAPDVPERDPEFRAGRVACEPISTSCGATRGWAGVSTSVALLRCFGRMNFESASTRKAALDGRRATR